MASPSSQGSILSLQTLMHVKRQDERFKKGVVHGTQKLPNEWTRRCFQFGRTSENSSRNIFQELICNGRPARAQKARISIILLLNYKGLIWLSELKPRGPPSGAAWWRGCRQQVTGLLIFPSPLPQPSIMHSLPAVIVIN